MAPSSTAVAPADHMSPDPALLSVLSSSAYDFLQPTPTLHKTSLDLAKLYLDPLAAATSGAQEERQQSYRKKRRRGEKDNLESQNPLRLKQVYLEGFSVGQVWEQARRVLDASRHELQRSLPAHLHEQRNHALKSTPSNGRQQKGPVVRFRDLGHDGDDSAGSEVGEDQEADADADEESSLDEEDDELEDAEMEDAEEEKHARGVNTHEELTDGDDVADEEFNALSQSDEESPEVFVPDKLGLNDGFFSIDDFNRQSEFLEQQDARGENDGAASDEEEDVDWGMDPLTAGAAQKIDRPSGDEDADVDEDDGPTFGNADLNGPDISEADDDTDSDAEMDDVDAVNNTNDIKYADFFAPPPRKLTKSARRGALPKTQPPPSASRPQGIEERESDEERQIQRTISTVRRDIFEDDLTPPSSPTSNSASPRSSHQKRQAALAEEIRRLEAASVAKRSWTLSGEARAADRPINSLLEEDLEFERVGKPIPVITQEVSEDIEAMIKRRILAREFDEVIRRRPGNLATGSDTRRGRIELSDSKPQQSLAEMYEAEHLQTTNPDTYTTPHDEALKRSHEEIEQMWQDVCAKLDALSSYHYRPKPPSASIHVVADVPTLTMEEARPGGAEVVESMLAPQEVYKAGEGANKKSEVVTKGGMAVGREEMEREVKRRRRRREKERIRKAGSGVMNGGGVEGKGVGVGGGKAKGKGEEKRVVGELKKGGVKVIGKKGEIRDVDGNAIGSAQGAGRGGGGGGYKL